MRSQVLKRLADLERQRVQAEEQGVIQIDASPERIHAVLTILEEIGVPDVWQRALAAAGILMHRGILKRLSELERRQQAEEPQRSRWPLTPEEEAAFARDYERFTAALKEGVKAEDLAGLFADWDGAWAYWHGVATMEGNVKNLPGEWLEMARSLYPYRHVFQELAEGKLGTPDHGDALNDCR